MTAPACKPTPRMLRVFMGLYAVYFGAILCLLAFLAYKHAWIQMAPVAAGLGAATGGLTVITARARRSPENWQTPTQRQPGLLLIAVGAALLLGGVIAAMLLLR